MPTLNFKGKTFVQNHHLAVKYHQLVPDKEKSLTDKVSLHDNLIIQGDNLLALKALLPTYAGKIKCIYIDPPYNTGNEGWAYNDNVRSPMLQQWLGKTVDRDDLTRHDKWLCMMTPRLKLLRELLSEDGVVFASIDDNEVHNLLALFQEVFNDPNWVGTMVWRNVTDNNPSNIAVEHEYIVCFAKNKERITSVWKSRISDVKDKLIEIGRDFNSRVSDPHVLQKEYSKWFRFNKVFLGPLDRYKYIDQGGVYTGSQSVHNPGKEGYRYDVNHPLTGKPCKQPLMGYRFPESTMRELLDAKRILFGDDESKIIELKLYASEYVDKLPSVLELDGRLGAYDLREVFREQTKTFDNPKPVQLIARVLSYVTCDEDLILDSFAGSGTTAHAVLDLNREDGGNRKFILIEQEDYADSITAERVRRVIARNDAETRGRGDTEKKAKPLLADLESDAIPQKPTFSFFRLGDPIEMETILTGDSLPPYRDLARYVFYTATGEEFDEGGVDEKKEFVGESAKYRVFMRYKPDIEYLKRTSLTLDWCRALPEWKTGYKRRLVFAPAKFVDDDTASLYGVDFCQLPYEIYRLQK